MYYAGESNVPGAPGQGRHVFNPNANVVGSIHSYNPDGANTTGYPVGHTPQPTGFMNLPGAIGNVKGMEVADMPRYIKSSPPPNVINKAPHIDSPFIDRWLKERNQLRGPQLPGFV